LHRDGVLKELVLRGGTAMSPRRSEDSRLIARADEAVHRLRARRLLVFVAANQPV